MGPAWATRLYLDNGDCDAQRAATDNVPSLRYDEIAAFDAFTLKPRTALEGTSLGLEPRQGLLTPDWASRAPSTEEPHGNRGDAPADSYEVGHE